MSSARQTKPFRPGAFLLVLPLLLAACKDSGLPGRNTPESEAAAQQWRYPLYESGSPGTGQPGGFVLGGQSWMSAGTTEQIPVRLLKPVGDAQGAQVYALTWDDAPYSRLYLATREGKYLMLVRGT